MSLRFMLACILLIYNYYMNKHVCSAIIEKEGLWFMDEPQNTEQWPKVINIERKVMMRETKASDGVDSGLQNHDSEMVTRMNNMEKKMNELMKSMNDILQIKTEIQKNIDSKIDHAMAQINDKFGVNTENQKKSINVQIQLDSKIDQLYNKFENLENKLKVQGNCDESVVNESHGMHRRDMNPSTLEQKVRNVERATSLLAISKIKLADLPYTMHCDSHTEDGAESHMEACIQTRIEKLYDDFNDVLDFHVMLVGGAEQRKGRVEIVYRGQHGTICDYNWDYNDAKVVCKMLGYENGGYPVSGSHYGNGTGEILLDKVECTGEEASLLGCKHRGIKGYDDVGTYCHHGRDAGVMCYT